MYQVKPRAGACGRTSNLTQNTVHNPVDGCCGNTIRSACLKALQMPYHLLDERKLDMVGILDNDFLSSVACLKNDGVVCKHGEAYTPLFSNQFYLVGLGTFVSDKAPAAASRKAVLESEGSRYRVFCLIKPASVSVKSGNIDYWPEKFLKQVYLVRGKVVEISSSGNIALDTPW